MVRTSDVRGALRGACRAIRTLSVLIDALGCSRSHPTLPGSICLEPNNAETLRENYDVQRNIIIFCQSGRLPKVLTSLPRLCRILWFPAYLFVPLCEIMAWSARKTTVDTVGRA